jgi:hypothetical protein
MKILSGPKKPWWVNKKSSCNKCGTRFQLEAKDDVHESSDRDGYHIIVACPNPECQEKVYIAKPTRAKPDLGFYPYDR